MTTGNSYTPKGITFCPTFECPGGCPHCNIRFDETDVSARLPLESAARVLHEAKNLGLSAFQVAGGEPTLCDDFLVGIFTEGRKLSMKCHRPPTNCSLASDPPRLHSLFSRLKQAGFSSGFRISLDRFHSRIPVALVAGFIAMASEYFSLKPFAIGCCDADEIHSEKLLHELAAALRERGLEAQYENRMLITPKGNIKTGFWAPTRPTWKNLPDEMFSFRRVDPAAPSAGQFRRDAPIGSYGCLGPEGVGYLWVDPHGDVRACCGNAVNFIAALSIGNIHQDSMTTIIGRARSSRLISVLAGGGPSAVVMETGAHEYLQRQYTHRCDLCHQLLTNPAILKKFGISG